VPERHKRKMTEEKKGKKTAAGPVKRTPEPGAQKKDKQIKAEEAGIVGKKRRKRHGHYDGEGGEAGKGRGLVSIERGERLQRPV